MSLGFSLLLPTYGATSCRLEILCASLLFLKHLGSKRSSANTNIRKHNTPAMAIPTILFLFLLDLEFDSCEADGPSVCFPDCFPGLRPEACGGGGGTVGEEVGPPPKNGGAGGGDLDEDGGEGNGAMLVLNGFPPLLHD